MQLLEADEVAQFVRILRRHHLPPGDFSLNATDTTDPKTDEIPALQGELTVRRNSTGQEKNYLISDSTMWIDLFSHDMQNGVFARRGDHASSLPGGKRRKRSH